MKLVKYVLNKWNYLSNLGIQGYLTLHDKRSIRFMNRFNTVMASMLLFFFTYEKLYENDSGISSLSWFFILFAIIPVLNKMGNIFIARILTCIAPVLLVLLTSLVLTKEGGDKYYLFFTSIIPLIVFRNKWLYIAFFYLNITVFFFITYYQDNYNPLLNVQLSDYNAYYCTNMFTAFFTIFLILHYFIGANEHYEKEIILKNQVIETKNKEMLDSILYAKKLQEAILSPLHILDTAVSEYFILYKPKDIVAGDFYWFYKETNPSKIWIAAADCTGHGVPGAMVSVVCNNALNKAVKEMNIKEPNTILDKVSEIVEKQFSGNVQEMKDGMDIALCCLEFPVHSSELEEKNTKQETVNTKLQFAGANNPLWIIYSDTNKNSSFAKEINTDIHEIYPDKQPIGKHIFRKPFTNNTVNLMKGDTFYLFSDGYADQFGGEKGKKFKYNQMKKLLLNIKHKSLSEQKTILDNAIEQWKGNLEQIDDICVIGIKI